MSRLGVWKSEMHDLGNTLAIIHSSKCCPSILMWIQRHMIQLLIVSGFIELNLTAALYTFETLHQQVLKAATQSWAQPRGKKSNMKETTPPRNGRDLRAFQTGCLSALHLNVSITHFPQLIVYPPHARFKSYLISSVALMWLRGGWGVESSFVVGRLPLWSEGEPANEARGPRNHWRAAWTAVDSALETKWTGWQYWGTGKPWGRT